MPDLTKAEAAKQTANEDLSKLAKPAKRKYTRKAKKRGPGRPRKEEVIPKHMVGAAKPKRGRPKGSGKVGRPKRIGKGKRGRPKVSGASKGLIGGLVAKAVKSSLKSQSKNLKSLVQGLVAKEVRKALKAALR